MSADAKKPEDSHHDPLSRGENPFVPLKMALRNQLGQLADEWMSAKIELIRKIKALIVLENDPAKLEVLQTLLTKAILSDEDVTHFDQVLTGLATSVTKNLTAWRNFKMNPTEK